ncbi:ABC transporter permease [Nocardioides plantarum]|uniref:FtsX-like permease family protein n=1 Tax=Nocardioides plantarum TaxID=29299 RepID=A0ABV5K563_9ACTN|nr:ABC transporter permease [Nocardioides plantarum]
MKRINRWRPALRIAWRDLLAHRIRTAVLTLLVALPITAAVVASTLELTEDFYSANSLQTDYGSADAKITVTPWPTVTSTLQDQGRYAIYDEPRGAARAERRAPGAVDLASLLPPGSRVTQTGEVQFQLATGGTFVATIADLDDPLVHGTTDPLVAGRAPSAPDEVAIPRLVADELGLLDGAEPADDASVALADGTALRVVGIIDPVVDTTIHDPRSFVLPPGTSVLEGVTRDAYAGGPWMPRYLVDLPDLSTAEAIELHDDLAAHGISSWMRDAAEHPRAWGQSAPTPTPADPAAVAAGAVVLGIGLTEVLVLVGAAFAVGARRQARTLGLLITTGASPADVRRTVLAQGLWVGVLAAVLGTGGGLAVLGWGRGTLGRLGSTTYYDYSFSVGTILVVAVLGVVSAVLAAAIPAWGIGRMTAVQALDGHVAVASGHRHRFRNPGLGLVGAGLLGLVVCGSWIARTFATPPAAAAPDGSAVDPGTVAPAASLVPVVFGGLCALVVLVGTTLALPWLISAAGRTSTRGWLPWRLATRDATRNRGRTTAAVLAVGIVTMGAVFAGMGVSAADSIPESDTGSGLPDGVGVISLAEGQGVDAPSIAALSRTLHDVVGAEELLMTWTPVRRWRDLVGPGGEPVWVVDDALLARAGVSDKARAAFAEGSALTVASAPSGRLTMHAGHGQRDLSLPAVQVHVDTSWATDAAAWISVKTAADLGATTLRVNPDAWWVAGPDGLHAEDSERLSLHGISAFTGLESYDRVDQGALVLAGALGVLVVTGLVVGLIVALSAAEAREDAATLAAVGAPPWLRRATSAGHALYVGGLGSGLGLLLGLAGGASLLQVVGTPGTPVPWAPLGLLVLGVPLLCAGVGWVVAPTRLTLTRRAG